MNAIDAWRVCQKTENFGDDEETANLQWEFESPTFLRQWTGNLPLTSSPHELAPIAARSMAFGIVARLAAEDSQGSIRTLLDLERSRAGERIEEWKSARDVDPVAAKAAISPRILPPEAEVQVAGISAELLADEEFRAWALVDAETVAPTTVSELEFWCVATMGLGAFVAGRMR